MKQYWIVLVAVAFAAFSSAFAQPAGSLVNFKHLEHLTETIHFDGDSIDIVHVYANAPDYAWVGAQESGMEGIACVDDAARAAVMYLRHYELNKDQNSHDRGVRLLKFVQKMETADGSFYNFLLKDHTINKDGKTSFKSFGWWACRGVWAMATGARVLRETDPSFSDSLNAGVERTFPHTDSLLMHYGKIETMNGFKIPQWLLYQCGSDATSELLLGLHQEYLRNKDSRVKNYLNKLADGLMIMQDGDAAHFPYGAHLSWQTYWHMWGNGQTQALASIGKVLNSKKMIASAEREAVGWYSRLLMDGFMKERDVSDLAKITEYEQIAYAVRPMTTGLLRLADATGKREYQKMAGLAASWFFGNNILHATMYDSSNGRGYDGIRDSASINLNSGAESTIEALMTMTEVQHCSLARQYSQYHKDSSGRNARYRYASFSAPGQKSALLVVDLAKNGGIRIYEGRDKERFLSSIRQRLSNAHGQ